MLRASLCFAVVAAAALSLAARPASAFTFGVDATTEECFFETIEDRTPVNIMFQVIEGGFLDIDIQIKAPDGRIVYSAEKQSEGKYNFISHVNGQYHFCFSNKMSTLTPKTVSFVLHVQDANNNPPEAPKPGAKVEDLTPLEQSIQQLKEGFNAVSDEQEYMRMRERVHRNTSESTNARVVWWSFFEVVVLLAMSLWQIFYVRRLFEVKTYV
jgi:p24 family protein beta-1